MFKVSIIQVKKKKKKYSILRYFFIFNLSFTISLTLLLFKIGTKRILELAKKMKKLKTFVHLSTAFCYADKEELDEKVYDPPTDPHDVMKMVEWLDESAIDLITPK